MQERAGELLTTVFRLGIQHNYTTTAHITAAINLLNTQAGNCT